MTQTEPTVVQTEQQYLAAQEMGEVHRLLLCVQGLKHISPHAILLHDSNGELLGRITVGDSGEWGFHYPAPQEAHS